jgi:hypothetical protein
MINSTVYFIQSHPTFIICPYLSHPPVMCANIYPLQNIITHHKPVASGGWETIRLTCMFLLESEIWKRSKKAFTSLAGSHRVDSTAFYHGFSQAKQRIWPKAIRNIPMVLRKLHDVELVLMYPAIPSGNDCYSSLLKMTIEIVDFPII